MRRGIAVAGLILLAACAQQPRHEIYVDASGAGRGQSALAADEAACEWEMAKLRAGPVVPVGQGPLAPLTGALLSSPPPGAFQSCLRAKGWRLDEVR